MKKLLSASAVAMALASCAEADTPTQIIATADQCGSVSADALGAVEASAKWIEAVEDLPAYCEVSAKLSPVEGSSIGVVFRMPETWNGKLLGLGGGGWAGNITLMAARDGLSKGYATMQTDGGNEGTDVWANSWVIERPASAEDFAHRAIHEMTVSGKSLAASYYGQEHEQAYFQGCSTGGRMALMEAQRYPDDYDAIIAGAPVYSLQVQTSSVFRAQTFAANDGAAGFSQDDLQLVQNAAVAQCDAADGLQDGLINDPASCAFDPASLQCDAGKTEGCITSDQVNALQIAYSGIRSEDGAFSMRPMRPGGEAGWAIFVGVDGTGADSTNGGGLGNLFPMFFSEEEGVTRANFSQENYATVRGSEFAAMYEATETDLSAFFESGGRLMLWHGENDAGPSPVGSNEYALGVLAGNEEASDQFRYFTLPGVGHCAGGPGADLVDYLSIMDDWVGSGEAPDRLIGTKMDGSITRPHCAWPQVAHFDGGTDADANNPDNWTCQPRD